MLQVSKDQATTFLVNHHRLHGSALPHLQSIEAVFQHLRLIQYDPLNPCGRNVDLVLQARLSQYHPHEYLAWAYEQRKGIDGYDKQLSLLPIEDWGYLHFFADRMSESRRSFIKEHRVELDMLILQIRDNGPLKADTLKDDRLVDIGWYGPSGWYKTALESLWRLGEVVSTRSRDGRKLYDLPERVYGHTMPARPSFEQHIDRRLSSVGLLPLSGGGTGWLGLTVGRQAVPALQRMVADGQFEIVVVEGSKKQYVVRSVDAPLLSSPPQAKAVMTFLAPLDNLLWDRAMIEDLFGFFYRWEVYTPLQARMYGYYTLPILDGARMVGRIEPVLIGDTLQVKGIWWEPDVKINQSRVDEAIDRFRTYLGAEKVLVS